MQPMVPLPTHKKCLCTLAMRMIQCHDRDPSTLKQNRLRCFVLTTAELTSTIADYCSSSDLNSFAKREILSFKLKVLKNDLIIAADLLEIKAER